MAAHEKAVSIIGAGPAQLLPFVHQAARFDPTEGAELAEDIAAAGGYLVMERGRAAAGFTIRVNRPDLWVTAAAGRSRQDLTRLITDVISAHRPDGVTSILFQTRRPGLVRKAARLGYQVAGVTENGKGTIMRKRIT